METFVIAVLSFGILLAVLVGIRMKIKSGFEFKNSDILLALVPVALWLFLTGKIQRLQIAGVNIESAFMEASESEVAPRVSDLSALPVEPVVTGPKGGLDRIPDLVENRSQALSFRLGAGGYQGDAIRDYLDELTQYPFLEHIVFTNPDNTFYGWADARQIAAIIRKTGSRYDAAALAQWINRADHQALEQLPGFVSARQALRTSTDKGTALQQMDALDAEALPVLDEAGGLAGVVTRSRLTAGLLADIAVKLGMGTSRTASR
jgi:hypothetical protein